MLLARNLRSRLRPPLAAAAAFSSAPAASASAAAAEAERAIRDGPRNDWSRPEIQAVYDSPLLDLLFHGVRTPARPSHMTHPLEWNGLLAIPKSTANPLLALGFGTGLAGNLVKDSVFELLSVERCRFTGKVIMFRVFGL